MSARQDRSRSADAPQPPRLVEWLVACVTPHDTSDAILGDLHERFLDRAEAFGRRAARRWYTRQALGFMLRVPLARTAGAVSAATSSLWSRPGWTADLRQAWRAFTRERGLTAAAVVVLALTIGAAATVFSLVNAVLLRPLPFADPDALVMLWDQNSAESTESDPRPITWLHYRAWAEQQETFASAGIFESIAAVIDGPRWSERVDAALVSASLLPTLGVQPALGRLFTPDDDLPGAPPVAILSHELWHSWFGGDAGVVGRTVNIDGEPTRIVGVMPADFWFYDPYAITRSYGGSSASTARLWRPLAGRFADEVDYPRYRMIARLRRDVSIESAAAALAAAERRLPLAPSSADGRLRIVSLSDQVSDGVRPRLVGLLAAVGLVLLIATVNLAGLLVARFDGRRADFAIRAALGAGRGRLACALMLHGALLGVAGAAAGLLVARAAVPQLLALVPRGLPLVHRVGIDAGVVLFALGAAVLMGLAVAGLASVRLAPSDLMATLGARSRTVAGRFARGRLTRAAIATQIALSLVLLISATLLLRSLVGTYRTDAGFEWRNTLTFQSLLMLASADAPPDFTFFDRLEARVAQLPGVESVGSATILPFSRWAQTALIRTGRPDAPQRANYRAVSPGYFEALRVEHLAGRTFAETDRPGAPPVAIVNQAFAERYLTRGATALGQRVTVARGREVERVIVGVVRNVKEDRLFAEDRPILYAPIAQAPTPMRQFVVRTSAAPHSLGESIRQTAAELDRRQPLHGFVPLDTLVAQSLEEERFYAVVAASFATIAVLLALSGLYGVVSFAVRERDREIGVRIALGASRRSVYRLVILDGMLPVLFGVIAGGAGAAATARLLRALIHGIAEIDPVGYFAATLAFTVVALVACGIPAWRAARIDAVQILNH